MLHLKKHPVRLNRHGMDILQQYSVFLQMRIFGNLKIRCFLVQTSRLKVFFLPVFFQMFNHVFDLLRLVGLTDEDRISRVDNDHIIHTDRDDEPLRAAAIYQCIVRFQCQMLGGICGDVATHIRQ